MATLLELIELAKPNFELIEGQMKLGHYEGAYMFLHSVGQPDEWAESRQSNLPDETGQLPFFKFNKWQLLEFLLDRLMEWTPKIISVSINQDKSRFAVTTHLVISWRLKGDKGKPQSSHGVATVYASSIEYLQLATPKSATEAKKNATKNICDFFGRQLNREFNEQPPQVIDLGIEKRRDLATDEVNQCKTEKELSKLYKETYLEFSSDKVFVDAIASKKQEILTLKKRKIDNPIN